MRGYRKVSQKSGKVGEGNKKKALVPRKKCAEKKVKSGVGASEVDNKASSKPLKPEISKAQRKRRAGRLEVQDKPRSRRVKGITLPSRKSTRICARRSSKEEIPEAPLRCVELIQRPFELREPATKLLFLASLGLYPRTGESDVIPIVVVRELSCSSGEKNGVRKTLELPLIPCYKKYLNLANHDKQSISENIMPRRKQPKRDNRKPSPATKNDGNGMKKSVSGRKTPRNSASPTNAAECPKPKQGQSLVDIGKLSTQQVKKKTAPSKANRGIASVGTTAIAEPMTGRPELLAFNFPDEVEAPEPINIIPSTSSTLPSRKRLASDNSNLNIEEIINSKNFINNNANMFAETKPVKKKQKTCKPEKNSRSSHPVVVPMSNSVTVCNSISVFLQNTNTNYPQSKNTDEALNLCMKKRNSEPVITSVIQLPPPKLQVNSNINTQKLNINGSKPLNLIIPRPPPLTKAPLEATNIAKCTQTIAGTTETTVQAKSLLNCMNGEENTCAQEVGESLDSLKTMLSRLQTRIGPTVNGVRLITFD